MRTTSTLIPPKSAPAVLVVNDHPAQRQLLVRMLDDIGCSVSVADDGAAAFNWLADDDHDVDLVLADVHLPNLDGPELARRLQQQPAHPAVILMSADPCADPEIPDVPFLLKPLSIEELYGYVESA